MSAISSFLAPREQKKNISEDLVYEVVKGKPVFYKGWKDVLAGVKKSEELKLQTTLQAWLLGRIAHQAGTQLPSGSFEMAAGELGLALSKRDLRCAWFSIFKQENFTLDDQFAQLPPEVVVEMDVWADTGKQRQVSYVLDKIDDLRNFGVRKVIWIFTKNKKVLAVSEEAGVRSHHWNADVEMMQGASFNLNRLLAEQRGSR